MVRHGKCALRLGKLAAGSTIFTQGIWRWLVECHPIGFVAKELEVVDECLQSSRIATIGDQYATRVRV